VSPALDKSLVMEKMAGGSARSFRKSKEKERVQGMAEVGSAMNLMKKRMSEKRASKTPPRKKDAGGGNDKGTPPPRKKDAEGGGGSMRKERGRTERGSKERGSDAFAKSASGE
jgi:hypothetical protein